MTMWPAAEDNGWSPERPATMCQVSSCCTGSHGGPGLWTPGDTSQRPRRSLTGLQFQNKMSKLIL